MMNVHYIPVLLTFIVACLMVSLLLPGIYSLPKNLLDQVWDWRKNPNREDNQSELENKIIYYFYASDLLTFSSVFYSITAALMGLFLVAKELGISFIMRETTIFYIIVSVYSLITTIILIFGGIKRSKSKPEWKGRICYFFICGILTIIFLIISLNLICKQCWPQLLFFMGIMLIFHIGCWLIPHVQYMPLTNLQILRKLIKE